MKNKIIPAAIIAAFIVTSCKKDKEQPLLASINVVNTAINAGAVKVNYFGRPVIWANYATQVANNAHAVFSLPVGNSVPLSIVPTADTLTPMYNNNLNLAAGEVYSLYLIGQAAPYESMLVKEAIPHIADSSVNVRVINLSPNSPGVKVTLSTSTTVNEFSNLAYKQSSEFKNYPAKAVNGASYTFQVRNAVTDAIIATSPAVTLNTYRFHSITLVLRGMVGSTPAAGVSIVRNY